MRYIALLRAINVGSHTVTMARLRDLFAGMDFGNVSTFIASGNVLFDSRARSAAALEERIAGELELALGFEVATFLRTRDEIRAISEHVPFGEPPTVSRPNPRAPVSYFVGFLRSAPDQAAIARLMSFEDAVNSFRVHGRELYWRRTGDSTSTRFSGATLERVLEMPATVRNLNTVVKLARLE